MSASVLFLVECGAHQGLGHLRRSLALAAALSELSADCAFFVTGPEHVGPLTKMGYRTAIWNPSDSDVVIGFDAVVLDGYHYDRALPGHWQGRLVRCAIDDTAERPQELEIIINHNLYGADCDYSAYSVSETLRGPEYALVLPAFKQLRDQRRFGDGILVSFGGTDDGRYAGPMARSLIDLNLLIPIHVAASAATPQIESLARAGVTLHIRRPLEEILPSIDLYVGGAGVTVLEVMAAGRRLVVCGMAPNHTQNVRAIRSVGIPAFDAFEPENMARAATDLMFQSANTYGALVDGLGAARAAKAILKQTTLFPRVGRHND